MHKKIFPDFESITRIDRRFPWKSPEETHTLAQKDVYMRLSGGVLSSDGRTWKFPHGRHKVTDAMIREHNRTRALCVLNCPRRYRHLAEQAMREFGVTRDQVKACFARLDRLRQAGVLPDYF